MSLSLRQSREPGQRPSPPSQLVLCAACRGVNSSNRSERLIRRCRRGHSCRHVRRGLLREDFFCVLQQLFVVLQLALFWSSSIAVCLRSNPTRSRPSQNCTLALLLLSRRFGPFHRLSPLFSNVTHDSVVGSFHVDAGLCRRFHKARSKASSKCGSLRLTGQSRVRMSRSQSVILALSYAP